MKTTFASRHPRVAAIGRLLGVMAGVWMLGSVYTPAVAATTTVPVDQQPLTVQPTIPPNITLMLDDSGSMYWDYMPDWGYLIKNSDGTFSSPSNYDQPRNASINGLYYNPAVTYTPPPKADSTSAVPDLYPNSPGLTSAYFDGFTDTSAADQQDITSYQANNNANSSGGSSFPYYQSFTVTKQFTDTPIQNTSYSCPAVPSGSPAGSSYVLGSESTPACHLCPSGYTRWTGSKCQKTYSSTKTPSLGKADSIASVSYSCPYGDSQSGSGSGIVCTYTQQVTQNYFTYTTGSGNTRHYVGTTGSCALLSTANQAVCKDDATTQQNVANWFSYYRSRILMAKTGLMTAFLTVNPKFRVGFASINGSGASWINNNLSNVLSFSTTTNSNNYLAEVQPFGNGSAGTQKASFWQWVTALAASGSTPLRGALDTVGQYYQSSQPWSTMSSDPTYGTTNASTPIACRQSYTILTTDGFWNDSYSSSSASGASGAKWPTITGPNNQKWPVVADSSPAAPYAGGGISKGTSLADIAMYYWENDLQPKVSSSVPGIKNEVPTSADDPAFWQHMTTFTMGLGFTPSDANGNAIDSTAVFSWANGGTKPSGWGGWPTPSSNSINNIADLAHAAVNGHGGFYSATSPQAFSSGLSDALKRAAARVGTGASLAANSTQLTSGTVAYQAQYVTEKWTGDLVSKQIDSSTGAVSSTNSWSAANMLGKSATNGTYPSRLVTTYAPAATWSSGAGSFVAFKNSGSTPPSLSSSQLSAMGGDPTAQANMVNYLRGDNTLEQSRSVGNYRNRTTVLGDIVDSQPVYSGAPNPNEFEGQSFSGMSNSLSSGDNSFNAFAVGTISSGGTATPSAASTRTPLVFVAANDGMLHAFKASDGSEQYAYLPGAVITAGLSNLSNPDYGSDTVPHQYYNDGELTIADVFFNSAWHTVLVGTTGRGPAKAVYALDITDPANITPLWERSAGDGGTNANYIGQMVGKPVIAQVADGNWQVLIGNGYNSANGTAALLEFAIADGTLSVHTTDSTAANGLAAPVTWMDDASNGISMEAYAGDLQGRVWEFPLDTATTTTASDGTTTTTHTADLSSAGTKEFTANSGGTVQPITAGMLAGRDPTTGNVWVFFGTGRYLSAGDLTNLQVQSWYGLIVQAGKNQPSLPSLPTDTQSGKLVQRSIIYEQDGDSSATPPTLGVRVVTTLPTPSDMSGKLGWYMDLEAPTGTNGALVAQGERMVTPSQFQGNLLLGTTRIPEAAVNGDICNSSGSGWVMAVDPFTGTNPGASYFQVNGGSGTVTLPNGKVVPVAGVGFSSLPNNPIFVGGDMLMSFDNGTTSNVNTSGAAGVPSRVSWQELVNP
jgi:type IV pilus assembly protein PilY1